MTHDFIQCIAGGFIALCGWFFGMFAEAQNLVPESWWQAGATVLLVSGQAYAIIHLWRALRSAEQSRITDRDSFITVLQSDIAKAEASREKLWVVLDENSKVIRGLSEKINTNITGPVKLNRNRHDDA